MEQEFSSQLLFIHPQEPQRSFFYRIDESQEQTLQSIVESLEQGKQCSLEFTDFFARTIPRNSTPEYFKALQPFYITKMIPKKASQSPKNSLFSKKFQVFVTTIQGSTLTLETCSSDTVRQIKMKIEGREGIPVEQQRLDFEGKIIEDNNTLSDYNIKSRSTLNLHLRLKGGMTGIEFVDITQETKAKIEGWSDDAPNWRVTEEGLTLEGICSNKNCEAFGEWVIINKGMTTYDHIYDEHENKCPMCSSYVNVEQCAFNNCRYGYSGMKLEKGRPPQKVTSQKEIEVGDHYKLFDAKIVGKAIWSTLKIVTKRIDQKASSEEVLCGICRKDVKFNGRKLDCCHVFHDECLQKTQEIIPVCSYCHF